MNERERFEQEMPLPENSDIEWHEGRQQYLTPTEMWKVVEYPCLGRIDGTDSYIIMAPTTGKTILLPEHCFEE